MKIADEGLILHRHELGERDLVVTIFSRQHGKIGGLIKVGQKQAQALQPGFMVQFSHVRRLVSQLGALKVEGTQPLAISAFNNSGHGLMVRYLTDLLHLTLAEEDPHPILFEHTLALLQRLNEPENVRRLAEYEKILLDELGYGLTLSGEDVQAEEGEALVYVSPRTGVAACERVGAPFKDKLLTLPAIFGGRTEGLGAAFTLTGHFLGRALLEANPRATLATRAEFMDFLSDKGYPESL